MRSGLAAKVFAAVALAVGGAAWAAPYGHYAVWKMITVGTSPSGSNQVTVDLPNLDIMIGDLAGHAMYYPPHFDSPTDTERARADVAGALKILEVFAANPQLPPAILVRIARLGNLGHNLDVPGAGQEATDTYSRLLSLAPQNATLNYEYGTFLAGTPPISRAIPYLEKAKSLGLANAALPLALAYAATGNQAMALQSIDSYLKAVPGDAKAVAIRDAIANGRINVQKTAPP